MLSKVLQKIIKDITAVAYMLWQRGWAESNAGNISVDVTDKIPKNGKSFRAHWHYTEHIPDPVLADRYFFITKTGACFRDLKSAPEQNVLLIRIPKTADSYDIVWGGDKGSRVTSELQTHMAVHGFLIKQKRLEKAVVHTHPTHLIAMTHGSGTRNAKAFYRLLSSMHPEITLVMPDGIGYTRFCSPGTEQLAEQTVTALCMHRLVIWEKHGCLSVGKDVTAAFDLIDVANKAAELFFMCKQAGYKIEGFSEDHISATGTKRK
jgi:rhamnulose-1-phosphate aldolase